MKSRRGISSVVGAVFAIIALGTTVGYITYSMTTLDNYNQAVLARNQQTADIANEKFQVGSATFVNNKLNITIVNTGNLPVNFTKIWITDTSVTNWVKSYVPKICAPSPSTTPPCLVSPANTLKNLGQDAPASLNLNTNNPYHVKLVTSRGNIQEFNINSGVSQPLFVQTSVLPQAVVPGYKIAVLYTVTNNQTGNNIILNLTPSLTGGITGSTVDASFVSGPTPSSYPILMPGSSVTFKWVYAINGIAGDSVTFSPYLLNVPATTVSDSVTVQNVAFAGQSANAFTANGLGVSGPNDAILYLHQEQTNTPTGTYQMYSGQPDSSNLSVIQLDTTSPSFYTNNDTLSSDIIIPPGKWNATLRYMSAPVPHTFSGAQYPDMIFHFEDGQGAATIKDSTANAANFALCGGASPVPTWGAASGPNATGAYTFDGVASHKQCFTRTTFDTHDNVAGTSTTTTGWFKTSTTGSKQVIYRVGNGGTTNPFYEIALDTTGHVVFSYSGHSGGTNVVTCTSAGTYANGKWHFFAAQRTNTNTCSLTVDNATPVSPGSGGGCGSLCTTAPTGAIDIGCDPTVSGGNPQNCFNGVLDDIMHWNSYIATSGQITDLLKTSYGANAQTLSPSITITDNSGNWIRDVYPATNNHMSFADSFGDYAASPPASSQHWGKFNFTTGQIASNQFIHSQERLKFKIQYVTPANGRLDMVMLIDNTGLFGGIAGSSNLEIPTPSATLPGYYIYSNAADGTVSVFNAGPYKAWITPNSRVVFEDLNGGTDYGSWVAINPGGGCGQGCYVPDSTLLSAGTTTQLIFTKPCTTPGPDVSSAGTRVPPGNYRLFVYFNGYDEKGNFIATSQYIGPVKVTGSSGSCPY